MERFWFLDGFITPSDIVILRNSFQWIVDSWEPIGVAAFTSLFDVNPAAFQVFIKSKVIIPCSRLEVGYSWETKQHSMRVMHAIQRCLSRLDKKEAFSQFMSELACRHAAYGATPEHFVDLVGCLQSALLAEFAMLLKRPSPFADKLVQLAASCDEDGAASMSSGLYWDDDLLFAKVAQPWSKFLSILSLAMITGIRLNNSLTNHLSNAPLNGNSASSSSSLTHQTSTDSSTRGQ